MKYVFAFLLLFIIPTVSMADWVGNYDKRRYVTESEKYQSPYNNVVKIVTDDGVSTGTIIAPNIILTCGHCVADVGVNNNLQYYTTDGRLHNGTVWHYKDGSSVVNDYALIVSKDSTDGPFLHVSDTSVYETNAVRIGYDSLKVLSNNEIKIVKDAFVKVLSKYTITYENYDSALNEIEEILKTKDCSGYADKSNCMNCVGGGSCIFDDYDRLKVQDSCAANKKRPVESGGNLLVTDCALSPGGSGAPLIDSGRKNIIGISVGTVGFMIGGEKEATSYAICPEQYQEKTKSLINMANIGLLEY